MNMPAYLRRPRLILFFIVFLLAAYLIWQARGAIIPFLFGLVIAYLLVPFVNMVQKTMPRALKERNLARPVAILLVYLFGLALIVASLLTIVPPIIGQVQSLYENLPDLYEEARLLVDQGLAEYRDVIPPALQQRFERNLQGFDPMVVLDPILGGTLQAVGAVRNFVSSLVGWIVIPFWLFFILNDNAGFLKGTMRLVPQEFRADAEGIRVIIDKVLSGYIRGQLLVALEIGVLSFIGLLLVGVEYSLLLGLIAGIFGVIPFIGAILGALPAIVVAFLQEPRLALWAILVFVVVQQIDNIIFSPRIMGRSVALHPAIIMVAIVVGTSLFGALGAIIAVPLTAVLRDIIQYIYIRIGEPLTTPVDALDRIGYGDSITPLMRDPVPVTAGKMELGTNQ
jgi:predicted PurR-regulated permease PerM